MPVANAAMLPFLRDLGDRHLGSVKGVTPALVEFADKLTVRDGFAVLRLPTSPPNANSIKRSFLDCTGFECVANDIHIEDFSPGMDAVQMLGQAIGFSKLIQQKLRPPTLPLRFIVSLDKFDGRDECIFTFHIVRPSESWLSENLEGYSEPVLTWTSSESPL
jgi:hypothetical protein